MSYGYPYISYSLNAMSFLFLITVPILTMRVLAEERHAKTDQLILTAPVSVGKIVTAKYLALAAVFSAAMACISISPLLLARFGTVPYGESYTAVRVRYICIFADGESGHIGGAFLCAAVYRVYDGWNYAADFIRGQLFDQYYELL